MQLPCTAYLVPKSYFIWRHCRLAKVITHLSKIKQWSWATWMQRCWHCMPHQATAPQPAADCPVVLPQAKPTCPLFNSRIKAGVPRGAESVSLKAGVRMHLLLTLPPQQQVLSPSHAAPYVMYTFCAGLCCPALCCHLTCCAVHNMLTGWAVLCCAALCCSVLPCAVCVMWTYCHVDLLRCTGVDLLCCHSKLVVASIQ